MLQSGNPYISQLMHQAADAERTLEAKLREFAGEGDDADVQSAFASHAGQAREHLSRLFAHAPELQQTADTGSSEVVEAALEAGVKTAKHDRAEEEATVHHLIAGCSAVAANAALYQVLAAAARASNDFASEELALTFLADERAALNSLFHFLPTRSKIAFNMLTLSEVDLAVETKAAESRLVES